MNEPIPTLPTYTKPRVEPKSLPLVENKPIYTKPPKRGQAKLSVQPRKIKWH